jgi:hypothetical protein
MSPTRLCAALAIALACLPADAAPRAFVKSTGNDANAAAGCTPALPCRSFQAAHGVVDAGGEIVALDTAGYGTLVISKSVSVIGNPGIIAGISVASGAGVSIATPGVSVTLRNLNINGVGGERGVEMLDGDALTIEDCNISNFTASFYASGVFVYPNFETSLRITRSVVEGNTRGLYIGSSTITDVAGSHITGNTVIGIYIEQGGGNSSMAISDSVISGNQSGIRNWAYAGTSRVSIVRATVANNAGDAIANRSEQTGTVVLTIGGSMVSVNGRGFLNDQAAGTAIFESLGNNMLRQNIETSFGTITVVPGL